MTDIVSISRDRFFFFTSFKQVNPGDCNSALFGLTISFQLEENQLFFTYL